MDDYINRQAAIKALREALYDYEDKTEKQFLKSDELDIYDWIQHRIFVQNMSDIDVQVILNLPSADVQPVRHGRWETDGMPMDDGEYLMTRCTVCGTAYEYGHNENYCGYCGARMDGEQDDEMGS